MANLSEIVTNLNSLTIPQLVELTKTLEQEWGVKAAPPAPLQSEAPKPPAEVQTEFTVILTPVTAAAKMNTIKLVRELMATGLKEAKEFVESAPKAVKEGVSKEEADMVVARLTEVGAVCEIK
jgi:large subunit ribosomal protein L7/L12